jgi:hypothetical protein
MSDLPWIAAIAGLAALALLFIRLLGDAEGDRP